MTNFLAILNKFTLCLTSVKRSSYMRSTVLESIPYLFLQSYLEVNLTNSIRYIIYSFLQW